MAFGDIFNSSFIIWTVIGIGLVHIYLRKTGKTFVEMITDIRESLAATFGE